MAIDSNEQIYLLTGITRPERKKVFSWLASLPEDSLIDIIQNGVKKTYQIKDHNPNFPGKIIKYSALILAARQAGWDTQTGKGYRVADKKQYDDFSGLRKAKAAAIIQKGRIPVLRRKILAYWGEIKQLRAEGMGFRPISEYLYKSRKIKTSATYLSRLWREVESNAEI